MTLNPQPTHPSNLSYVLKLHRDTAHPAGEFRGRLEHIVSGRHIDFTTGEQLLALLARELQTVRGVDATDR
jgi:hypothetical protein